jgi:flavin-dependent dehydrogenase
LIKYDVSIIGSGPAAISAAIRLAEHNLRVVVFCKNETELANRNLGETLSRSVTPSLTELGVFSLFQKLKLKSLEGSISSWGTARTEQTSALLHPLGFGWVVQKDAFKKILLERATSLGATFCTDPVRRVERKNEVWRTLPKGSAPIGSDLMIIATGRDNPGFATSSRKVPLDKLVACIATFEDCRSEASHFVNVDSSVNGWFFSVKSDEQIRVLSFFTDGDLLPFRNQREFLQMANHHLPNLPAISKAIEYIDTSKAKSFCVVSANSTFRKHFFSNGLFFCGDSAQTFDPLSSQGISAAISDGIEIANRIVWGDFRNKELVIELERGRRQRYLEYLKLWHKIYLTEQRWTENVFWQRRQQLQPMKTFVNAVRAQGY